MILHKNPKISIVMPVYNGKKYLVKALESFLAQDYSEKELVIVDGKSTDGSHEIIREYCKKYTCLMWVDYADAGLADATNYGIKQCTGEIIGYFGSDDFYLDGIFSMIARYNQLVDYDAIYFNSYAYFINEKKCLVNCCPNIEFTHENLVTYGNIVGLQNIFFKRDIFETYSFNIKNKYCFDYELYLELTLKENYLYLYVDQTATINMMDGNLSMTRAKEQTQEAQDVAKKYLKAEVLVAVKRSIAERILRKCKRMYVMLCKI